MKNQLIGMMKIHLIKEHRLKLKRIPTLNLQIPRQPMKPLTKMMTTQRQIIQKVFQTNQRTNQMIQRQLNTITPILIKIHNQH